jgi:hypothetical protein
MTALLLPWLKQRGDGPCWRIVTDMHRSSTPTFVMESLLEMVQQLLQYMGRPGFHVRPLVELMAAHGVTPGAGALIRMICYGLPLTATFFTPPDFRWMVSLSRLRSQHVAIAYLVSNDDGIRNRESRKRYLTRQRVLELLGERVLTQRDAATGETLLHTVARLSTLVDDQPRTLWDTLVPRAPLFARDNEGRLAVEVATCTQVRTYLRDAMRAQAARFALLLLGRRRPACVLSRLTLDLFYRLMEEF